MKKRNAVTSGRDVTLREIRCPSSGDVSHSAFLFTIASDMNFFWNNLDYSLSAVAEFQETLPQPLSENGAKAVSEFTQMISQFVAFFAAKAVKEGRSMDEEKLAQGAKDIGEF